MLQLLGIGLGHVRFVGEIKELLGEYVLEMFVLLESRGTCVRLSCVRVVGTGIKHVRHIGDSYISRTCVAKLCWP